MFLYRDKEARTIALDRPALTQFLREEDFEDAFLRDLGIFFLPSETEEEDSLLDDSPVSNNVLVYTTGVSQEDLTRHLLEQIRECALEETQSPWVGKSFGGAEDIEDWEEDVKQFGEKAGMCHFLSLSPSLQPTQEWDDFFVKREPQREEISQQQESAFTYLVISVVAFNLFFQRLFHR